MPRRFIHVIAVTASQYFLVACSATSIDHFQIITPLDQWKDRSIETIHIHIGHVRPDLTGYAKALGDALHRRTKARVYYYPSAIEINPDIAQNEINLKSIRKEKIAVKPEFQCQRSFFWVITLGVVPKICQHIMEEQLIFQTSRGEPLNLAYRYTETQVYGWLAVLLKPSHIWADTPSPYHPKFGEGIEYWVHSSH